MDKLGRWGGKVALYMEEQVEYMELCWRDEPAERLWVRISGQTNTVNSVGVSYRPPSQEKEADEAFFRQLEEASC